jgi:hypothetical protein
VVTSISAASVLQEMVSDSNTSTSLLIGWIRAGSSPLYRMQAFLLVKTKERHVILSNAFPHLEAISPRAYSDWLSPSEPDLWRKLAYAQIPGLKPHKITPSSATYTRTSSPINKSKFRKRLNIRNYIMLVGTRGSVGGWGTTLQAGRSRVRVPMRWIFFFNLPNPSGRTMVLGSTQPLTELSTRNLLGG